MSKLQVIVKKPALPVPLNTTSFIRPVVKPIVKPIVRPSLPVPVIRSVTPIPLQSSIVPKPLVALSLIELKLPRAIEADSRKAQVEVALKRETRKLWEKSSITVSQIELTPALEARLRSLVGRKQIQRGLERIDQLLASEQKGLIALQKKQATSPSHRISRLLVVTNDGSERFYRACEKTLLQNKERTLLLYLNESSGRLADIFIGEKVNNLKAVLISDRDAVSEFLFSLAETTTTVAFLQ